MARNDTTSATTASTKQFLVWRAGNHFEARELSAADTKALGATEGKKLRWSKDNDWRVDRAEVPLSDDQLSALLERDDSFKLVEG